MLVMIGPGWLHAKDEDGQRRLDHELDFVRIELRAVLQRKIRVIPVLLNGTRMRAPRTCRPTCTVW